MLCPYCNADTKVTNSRSHNNGAGVWRRRQCQSCKALWTTKEAYDLASTHLFKPRSSASLQPFYRDKLFLSIKDSLSHRKTALEDATALTDTIIGKVLAQQSAIIEAKDIIAVSEKVLNAFDITAGAVYKATHTE